jgi:hypothetical protein
MTEKDWVESIKIFLRSTRTHKVLVRFQKSKKDSNKSGKIRKPVLTYQRYHPDEETKRKQPLRCYYSLHGNIFTIF